MRLSPLLLVWLPLLLEEALAGNDSRSLSTHPGADTMKSTRRGKLRSLGASSNLITNPFSRHDDVFDDSPVADPGSQNQPAPTTPPRQNGNQDNRPPRADVFNGRDPGVSALGRHDDDPMDPDAGERQQDMENRHTNDPPGERDVSGGVQQFSFPPSTNVVSSQSPTATPSMIPSNAPSMSAVPTTSPVPSLAPSSSATVSFAPSMVPSVANIIETQEPSVSDPPSTVPTSTPSSSPSFDCNADDAGFFGNVARNTVVVNYRYEMEYLPLPSGDFDDMLNAIEKRASDTVLPALFPNVCGSGNATNSTTGTTNATDGSGDDGRLLLEGERQRRRRLAVVGISPRPDERIDPEAKCAVPVTSPVRRCNVTDGALTVFLDGDEANETQTVLDALKAAMNAGEFNEVDDNIRRISFVDIFNSTGGQEGVDPARSGGSGNGFPVWAYVLIALGCLLIIGLGIFIWRRRQTMEVAKDPVLDEDEYNTDGLEDLDENRSYQPPDGMSRLTTQEEEDDYDDYEEDTRK